MALSEVIRRHDQSYYAEDDKENTELPLFVNCVGEAVVRQSFATCNRRGRNDYYLMYMQNGELDVTFNGRSVTLCAGDALCLRAHTPYSYTNARNGKEIRYYWIHFSGYDCEKIALSCGLELEKACCIGLEPAAEVLFEELFAEFRNRRDNFVFAVGVRVQHIFLLLARAAEERLSGEVGTRIDASVRYIHTHIRHELSVQGLAEMAFLSPSRYRELFKCATGLSPMDYITELRLRRARELLAQGELSTEQVSVRCGYQDRTYFQRIFKKRMGCTPCEYRRSSH